MLIKNTKFLFVFIILSLFYKNDMNCQDAVDFLSRSYNEPLLIRAIKRGDIARTKKLIENGTDIDIQNENGETALFEAINNRNPELVQLLVNAGAGLEIRETQYGRTPLVQAIQGQELSVLKILLDAGCIINEEYSPLFTAISVGSVEIFNLLLDYKADPEAVDKYNSSLLFSACHYGRINIINKLILSGADVNHENINGWTPLIRAVCSRKIEAVKRLLEEDIHINHKNREGDAAVAHAIRNDDADILKLLVDKGADIKGPIYKGRYSALKQAEIHNKKKSLQYLNNLNQF